MNSTKHLKKNKHQSFSNSCKKLKRTLLNSFYDINITLIPKSEKDIMRKKKLQDNIPDEHRCKNPQQHTSKPKSTLRQKDHTP